MFQNNGFTFLLVHISLSHASRSSLTNISNHDIIINKSHIICDGGIMNDSCIGKTIICPDGFDCKITCDIFSNEQSQSSTTIITDKPKQCITETYGCCATNIYCPYGTKCDIICSGGCKDTSIYGTNASYLEVKHCDLDDNSDHWSTCHDMTVYCPFHGRCEFEGNYRLQSSYIHSKYGFDNIYLEYGLLMDSSVIFCGPTGNEYNCLSNDEATQCLNDNNICVNITENNWYYNESLSESSDIDDLYNNMTTSIISSKKNTNDVNVNSYFDMNNKLQMFGYGIVILLLLIPIITFLIAAIYHQRLKGSDSPEYMSVFKCFINITDLYTDIIFCLVLKSDVNKLFYVATCFTILPHIISITFALWIVHKWREYEITFIKKYDNLVIGLTVLAGFVPTIELLSSKLFYASRLTLQISDYEKLKIQQFRFLNNNILENIPLIIIQILTAFNNSTNINPITIIAFCFSLLSAIIGILTLISRCLFIKIWKNIKLNSKLIYKLDIKSISIETRHYYCHKLFAKCLCHAMETNDGRIETIEIIPIVDGISCQIEILSNEQNHENINLLLNQIADNESDVFLDFKSALKKMLCIIECDDLCIIVTKLDQYGDVINDNESDNDESYDGINTPKLRKRNTYVPLRQTSSTSLHSNTNIINTCNHRLSVSSCGDMIGEPSVKSFNNNNNNNNNNSNNNIGYTSVLQIDGNYTNNDIIDRKYTNNIKDNNYIIDRKYTNNIKDNNYNHDYDDDDDDDGHDDTFSINAVNGSCYESEIFSRLE